MRAFTRRTSFVVVVVNFVVELQYCTPLSVPTFDLFCVWFGPVLPQIFGYSKTWRRDGGSIVVVPRDLQLCARTDNWIRSSGEL